MVEFKEYEQFIAQFAMYPKSDWKMSLAYTALGLTGEAGEYSEKIKKYIRDNILDKELAVKELGDVLWYLTRSANELGYTLADVARINAEKLLSRKERGVLRGSGDER